MAGANGEGGWQTSGRGLREGMIVAFYDKNGEKLMVVPNAKFWGLQPCGEQDGGHSTEGARVQFFGANSLFVVRRREDSFIFQSLGAEGRSLQAVSGPSPHRCTNYNFGPWESWEATPEGLKNVKWPNKSLGYDIREISCIPTEDLRRIERGHQKTSRIVQQQVRCAEERYLESEKKHQDLLRANQRQANLHQKEFDEIRSRLAETQTQKQKHEVEALQMSAKQQQLDLRIAELSGEKDALEKSLQGAQAAVEALKRDLQSAQERHVLEMRKVQRSFDCDFRALKKERDLDLQRAKEVAEKQQKQVHDEIQQREHQRALLLKRVTSEHKNEMKLKDAENRQLVKECHRLMTILKKIKKKMEDAQQARQTYEASPSVPGGYAPWQRRSAQSFVPHHSGSSVIQDPAIFSSGGSQVDFPAGSPVPGAMPDVNMDVLHGLQGSSYSHYRNPRASPPASAVSGDWMERSASQNIVEQWMEKGQDGAADGIFGKRLSSDGSCGPGREPFRIPEDAPEFESSNVPDHSCEHASNKSEGKDSREARSSPALSVVKGAFGSATVDRSNVPESKWEAAQKLTVTTPSLDRDESDPPKSPEASCEEGQKVFPVENTGMGMEL